LRLVLALAVPRGSYPGRGIVGADPGTALRTMARRELADMHRVAEEIAPGLPVSEDVIESGAVAVLRAQAHTASLVVIGNDGLGHLADLVFSGVARGLAGHIDVPLVVVPQACDPEVRGRADGRAPVVVGDDGSSGARAALAFAAARAAERDAALVVVRAGPDARLLSEDAPTIGADRPPAVRVVIAEERADRVLADQARDAQLVVLGVGEHGWLRHRHHVRTGVVLHATCPVVVVPPGATSATTPADGTGVTVAPPPSG
jgi:nucleotide-binding universal stress UspA family protein